ncbi:MAG: family 43 glycosylhydrolase [Bacteroidales bacterium]|nr:family 43 glycosylhydrolase [Bacteroidales bacterium]
MKLTCLIILFTLGACQHLKAQNPVSPPGVYIADPSARAWSDGKLYIYGSSDESCDYYCSWKHDILYTDDMLTWKLREKVFSSDGPGDAVSYNSSLLFAPDCAEKDGTYYLYYCQPDPVNAEGVALSDSPLGPFAGGKAINTHSYNQIDPAVFIDDDGTAYYLWGQFSLKMAQLKPGMQELDPASIKDSILTESIHHFHEGAFMTKRNGIYYLVYADISRKDTPTCLGYATSAKPYGPYEYRGVIIDNDACNPGNWNNHGSIAEFKGQWYVFYHRSTHGCKTMRKACVEKISFRRDGSIPEVEMTSQGAGEPLNARKETDAACACLLHGKARIIADSPENEILSACRNGDAAIYKYLDFGSGLNSVKMRIRPLNDGKIILSADKPWSRKLGEYDIVSGSNRKDWQIIEFAIEEISGVHALWIQFRGDEGKDLFELDWFRFE